MPPTARASIGLRGLSEVLRFDLARHRIGVSVVVPGAVKTPLVDTVHIAGVDRDDPNVRKWTGRFAGHAVSPEVAADKILRGVAKNRYLVYTSSDIRALYLFKRTMWLPYSMAMTAGERPLHPGATAEAQAALRFCYLGAFERSIPKASVIVKNRSV